MKVSGTLSGFNNSIVDMNVYIDNPLSGFELTAMETGNGTRYNIFSFSGSEGYIYDQSGWFFGGYKSGVPFDIQAHYNYTGAKITYYFDDQLICNNVDPIVASKSIDSIEFEKYGNSTISVSISGVIS